MKSAETVILPEDLNYTDEHVWVRQDGDTLVAGISDYAQDQLGEVAYVDLPEVGRRLDAHDEFGSIESVKAVNALFMPVAGEIVEVNEELEDAPELVNADCYGKGWIVRIKADDPAAARALPDAAAYRALLK
ncbi:glycine cleavage system protein GcvH [Desulfovibrio sp.]|uniref:glycine cleavage system protein GcvH n=1 Tax=Desulfovibrio sp. TaxID=885 RepID=UPI0023CE82C6|nr:glycine cleavage system protein GcvH [Desulfovibrio sp.]MDE7240607.1 glycine cleavage system protein GcvH [Desulfovibrio sp.]